ncbi:hypothetical protein BBK36DRAFT_1140981 [Trichoderma citrinoviride]|uniref:Uncharacterized protein n=1 Tax=Trichoderma citrinoviride TaxID=58853 RepID=A0A2T4B9V3_9HYPO|nr:hypothetical protein BBK36DRAFT_1140981 [Trichoderma citrinoviride]PTB66110.1 hypothetical protein BBK36DRAFT_1140981 [Trichoderma citrinoviride]
MATEQFAFLVISGTILLFLRCIGKYVQVAKEAERQVKFSGSQQLARRLDPDVQVTYLNRIWSKLSVYAASRGFMSPVLAAQEPVWSLGALARNEDKNSSR